MRENLEVLFSDVIKKYCRLLTKGGQKNEKKIIGVLFQANFIMIDSSTAWFFSSLICVVFTIFNITTIFVILCTRNQRNKVKAYPILFFLAASALQGFVAFPLYIFKKIAYKEDVPTWLCDASRFTYMHTGHVLKISLLLVSFDRLFSIKNPFRYREVVSRTKMIALIIITWFVTVAVDAMPFYVKNKSDESCHYVPTRVWGFCVIVCYDLLPFGIMGINYMIIWCIAARLNLADNHIKEDLKHHIDRNCEINTNGSKIFIDSTETDKDTFKIHTDTRIKSKAELLLEMKATKTSLLLLLVYIVCWAPLGIFYMVDQFCGNSLSDKKAEKFETARAAIKILSSTSSLFAPIVYCWWNHEFFEAATTLLHKYGCKFFRQQIDRINLVQKPSL